jgi:cytochrome b subunit of formate dehydrogenase
VDNTKKQVKQRKFRGYLYDFGKFLVDIAKLAFGSLVLGTVIRWDIPHTTLFIVGILFTVIIAFTGIIITRSNEEK